ncbi:MAG: transglycosylase domain-containing protein, partial [Pseudomonadota bacterium]|nr:transglycosylase domain-containing protein [Pseudomonadota bacterium]
MKFSKWVSIPFFTAIILAVLALIPLGLAATLVYPRLPSLQAMRHYHPKMPLRVYTEDGALIGEFGVQNRTLVKLDQVPKLMQEAIISAEDSRFYQNDGVDYRGILRAALSDLIHGGKVEGASTITMQVARNFYLSNEKTFSRKISEVLLAWKIEHNFTKDQILQLYINQIYLGQRAYGFEAAAETYFGKRLNQLNLAEMAVLAGLPKAPSTLNPIASLTRCRIRQHYVLGRMLALKYITKIQYEQALRTPIIVNHAHYSDVRAGYVAEMVRQAMYNQYGPSIYTSGMKVYTTLRSKNQAVADKAMYDGIMAYDQRHGYRGPEGKVDSLTREAIEDRLSALFSIHGLKPAVVLSASPHRVEAYLQRGKKIWISGPGLAFAHQSLMPSSPHPIVPGSIIRVEHKGRAWQISQVP